MATCIRPRCPSLVDNNAKVVPNPDISGPGVLIGFISTAYITLMLVLIHYLLDCGPEPAVNPIDRGIIDFVWKKIGRRPSKKKKMGVALRRGVLMFSDQQVVTGIAILSAGYSQLHCGLSSYHWEIVVYLAWFSSLTHLTTLTVLCQYFHDNPLIRNWRAAFMLATVALLGVALLPTAKEEWGYRPGVPAQCFFDLLGDSYAGKVFLRGNLFPDHQVSTYLSLVVLLVSFVTRVIKLSKRSSVFTRRWIRTKPGGLLKKWLGQLNRRARISGACSLWKFVHEIILGVYVMLKAVFDINESMVWEINWLIYALAWGTVRLHKARQIIHDSDRNTTSEEDSWGFGQWIPVLLLMLPLLAMGETFYELFQDSASKDDNLSDTQCPTHGVRLCITDSPQVDPLQDIVKGPGNGVTCIGITSVSRTGNELGFATENDTSDNHHQTASVLSRSEPVSFGIEESTNESGDTSYDRDFYQYAWFRLLIFFILLIVCMVASFVIGFDTNFVSALYYESFGSPFLFLSVPTYSLIFVFLDGYQGPISNLLQMLRIRRHVQLKLSRFLPYFVIFLLSGTIGIWIFGLFPSWMWYEN